MKTTRIILLAIASLFALVSCDFHKTGYISEFTKDAAYVRFLDEPQTYGVKETEAEGLKIPVKVYSNSGINASVAFSVTDLTAVKGADYDILPANGILSFTAGSDIQYITVIPVDKTGLYTKDVEFKIDLTNAEGVTISGARSVNVKVLDTDNPLLLLTGNYVWEGEDSKGDPISYNVSISLEEDTKDYDDNENTAFYLSIVGADVFDGDSGEIIMFPELESKTITLPFDGNNWQAVYNFSGIGPHIVGLAGYDTSNKKWVDDLVATWDEDGNYIFSNSDCLLRWRLWDYYTYDPTGYIMANFMWGDMKLTKK